MKLTAGNVEAIMAICMIGNHVDPITVEGLVNNYPFSKAKVAESAEHIREMLAGLPEQFERTKGGGWTFLNACQTRDGDQWTGFHQTMEQLVCLGIAAGRAGWLMKEMANIMPGGVPYFWIDTVGEASKPIVDTATAPMP